MRAAHKQEGDWIAWAGGDCPVDFLSTTRVDVRQRDGTERLATYPIACDWFHHDWDDDVLAYRVIGLSV